MEAVAGPVTKAKAKAMRGNGAPQEAKTVK